MRHPLRYLIWVQAAVVAVGICCGTGLIPAWGKWYSPSMPLRRQTEAFFAGHIAISTSPAEAEYDMAWSEGGVQQPWGLGVPIWRMSFEAVARLFHESAFPDRLGGIAIMLSSYMALRAFTVPAYVAPPITTIDSDPVTHADLTVRRVVYVTGSKV